MNSGPSGNSGPSQPHRETNPHPLLFQVLKVRKLRQGGSELSHGARAALAAPPALPDFLLADFSLPVVDGSSFKGITFLFLQAEMVPADKTGEL